MDVRYPDITVHLTGRDGNAFNVLSLVTRELRAAGVDQTEIDQFMTEATAGDYGHLLETVLKWVEVRLSTFPCHGPVLRSRPFSCGETA